MTLQEYLSTMEAQAAQLKEQQPRVYEAIVRLVRMNKELRDFINADVAAFAEVMRDSWNDPHYYQRGQRESRILLDAIKVILGEEK